MLIICLDPSGNSSGKEGSGTTGIAFFRKEGLLTDGLFGFDDVKASDFEKPEDYWYAIWMIIWHSGADVIVCESYRLFGNKAAQQTGSSMETPQLIGFLRMICWMNGKEFVLQDPSTKIRHSDEVMVETGLAELIGGKHYVMGKPTNLHIRDAIRHGLYYLKYGQKETPAN